MRALDLLLDLEDDCSYWPGIGFSLAEVDNMGRWFEEQDFRAK